MRGQYRIDSVIPTGLLTETVRTKYNLYKVLLHYSERGTIPEESLEKERDEFHGVCRAISGYEKWIFALKQMAETPIEYEFFIFFFWRYCLQTCGGIIPHPQVPRRWVLPEIKFP